jgi:hydroxymethylbilane synthase
MTVTLVLGSRASALALTQSRFVIAALQRLNPGLECEIRHITTHGDRVLDRSLTEIGGKGVFVKEIEEALLGRRIDRAVHSAKDVPTALPAGLGLLAFTRREDPSDAFVGRLGDVQELAGARRIGTSSLRRAAQIRHLRPDLRIVPLR